MFDLLDRPLIWIPVKWAGLVPSPDDADVAIAIEHRIDLYVEILGRPEFIAWQKRPVTSDEDFAGELETFKVVVSNWRRVTANGKAVPFSDENALKLLSTPGFAEAFAGAYFEAWQGRAEERAGNSADLPPAGQVDAAKSGTLPAGKAPAG